MGKRKGSPCQQDGDGDSQALKIMRSSTKDLPEDILYHIHSLLPMREAARAACVSRAFLHSWRCHPNLIFNNDTIGLKRNGRGENFHHRIDRILRNHSSISLKTFNLDYRDMLGYRPYYYDSWLQIALVPGIEKLTLWLPVAQKIYNFPCSLLSDGVRNSLQYLELSSVVFHPTVELGPLRRLTSLHLSRVNITWDELKCLLCNSLALEQLQLEHCVDIICLKIPCTLQRLSNLSVYECVRLKVIESKAPNVSSIFLRGHKLNFSLVETLQMKKLEISCVNFVRIAREDLPSIMPNLETLVITSGREVVDTPMLPTKFLNLKHLTIWLTSSINRTYDYFSLVSFLDASPSLETLVLTVSQLDIVHESVFENSQLRDMPESSHGHLQSVKISGFSSSKRLVELACYILKSAVSLECLTLETTIYSPRCGQDKYTNCFPIAKGILMEVPRALSAIRTYIENKVPPTVKLTVLEPCCRCHGGRI